MDSFESRINLLGIDCDIIQQQFSADGFIALIEKHRKQSCDNIVVIYKEESELLKRIAQSKKVTLKYYEDKVSSLKSIFNNFMKRTKDFVVFTNDLNLQNFFTECRPKELNITGINMGDDLHWKLKGQFVDILEVQKEIDDFFLYNEEMIFNIKSLTKADYKKMISNASNKVDHQLRVSKCGEVWMSRIVGAEDIEDLQFRWNTYDSFSEYTGIKAASDIEYINETYNDLKWDWDNGESGYIDF